MTRFDGGRAPRGLIGGALLAVIVVVGLVALALGKPRPGGAAGSASPSGPVPTSAADATPASESTTPSVFAERPEPWDWALAEIPGSKDNTQIRETWALPGQFVALLVDYETSSALGGSLLVSPNGTDWAAAAPPESEVLFATGVVFCDELWLVGVTGEPDAVQWHFWSTP